jgi:hypothetical protein
MPDCRRWSVCVAAIRHVRKNITAKSVQMSMMIELGIVGDGEEQNCRPSCWLWLVSMGEKWWCYCTLSLTDF